jgi:hypothetical protein
MGSTLMRTAFGRFLRTSELANAMVSPFALKPFTAVMLSMMFALSDDQLALVMTAASSSPGGCRKPGIDCSSLEHSVGLALSHHFLAVGVECIVNDPLSGIECVIVLVAETAEAIGNGFKSRSFGLMVKRVVGIGAVDDFA